MTRRTMDLLAAACAFFCAALPTAWGQAPPLSPVAPFVLTRMSTHSKLVALTFDACQTHKMAGFDSRIVSVLRETQTPATLMLGGRWMDTHPDATRALAASSLFEIGSHSYWHPHMTRLSAAQIQTELQQTQNAQWRLTGRQGTLFRPPYGELNARLVQTAARMGLTTMTWDVVTGDPDPHISAPDIVRTVLARVRPGSIVIMHINGRGWHTAEALPTIIHALRARGWRFVTVSQMRSAARPGRILARNGVSKDTRGPLTHSCGGPHPALRATLSRAAQARVKTTFPTLARLRERVARLRAG